MAMIDNWNGQPVAVRRSRGGVLTFERWEDNVLGAPPWPEALLGHVRGYVARPDHFAGDDADALAAHLGRISKFQSVNSEDAVTYRWFGTLASPLRRTTRSCERRDSLRGDPQLRSDAQLGQSIRIREALAAGHA